MKTLKLERRGAKLAYKIHGNALTQSEMRVYQWAYFWGFMNGWTFGSQRQRRRFSDAVAQLNSGFERSVPSLPEGKAACARLSCQRICDTDELSGRGWCPQCERLDLTRVQLRDGRTV